MQVFPRKHIGIFIIHDNICYFALLLKLTLIKENTFTVLLYKFILVHICYLEKFHKNNVVVYVHLFLEGNIPFPFHIVLAGHNTKD